MFSGSYIRKEGMGALGFIRAFILLFFVVLCSKGAFASDMDSLWVNFTGRKAEPLKGDYINYFFTWETYSKYFNGKDYATEWGRYDHSDSISYLVTVYSDSLFENVDKTITVIGKEVRIDSLKVNKPYWLIAKPESVPNPSKPARTDKVFFFAQQPVKNDNKVLNVLTRGTDPLIHILLLSISINVILLFLIIIKKKQSKA
jgi:hypothetical protein